MTDVPQRRFLDRQPASPTLVGQGSHFEGELRCQGDVAVAGTVRGEGQIGGLLTLTDSGQWQGTLSCRQAVVAGQVEGDLIVAQQLEIRASARIRGRVTARHIAIAAGAIVEGDLIVSSGEPVRHFAEQRND